MGRRRRQIAFLSQFECNLSSREGGILLPFFCNGAPGRAYPRSTHGVPTRGWRAVDSEDRDYYLNVSLIFVAQIETEEAVKNAVCAGPTLFDTGLQEELCMEA